MVLSHLFPLSFGVSDSSAKSSVSLKAFLRESYVSQPLFSYLRHVGNGAHYTIFINAVVYERSVIYEPSAILLDEPDAVLLGSMVRILRESK